MVIGIAACGVAAFLVAQFGLRRSVEDPAAKQFQGDCPCKELHRRAYAGELPPIEPVDIRISLDLVPRLGTRGRPLDNPAGYRGRGSSTAEKSVRLFEARTEIHPLWCANYSRCRTWKLAKPENGL